MTHTKLSRLFPGALAIMLAINIVFAPLNALAATLTISQDGPNLAIDPSLSVGTGEWRLSSTATALPNTNGNPANISLVFGYVDAQNYYYVNFATTSGAGLSGAYRIASGVRTTIATSTAFISASSVSQPEIRNKDGAIRVYLGNTFLYKTGVINTNGTKLGVATEHGNATFANTVHNLGTVNTTLNLTLVGGSSDPTPIPTPPTVQVTAPTINATVSGVQTVAATASDAQAVTSVQFKLDGNNLGAADTSAPYTANWDTTTATNAAHALSAVAMNQAGLSTTSTTVTVNVNNQSTPPPVTPPAADSFTVSETGPNAGIDPSLSTGGGAEWRLSSKVTATAGATTPANFSLVFGYVDNQNYYYANFASAAKPGLSGVYRVSDGISYKLLTYANFITPGQATTLEVRYSDGVVRLYLNGAYLNKAEGITGSGNRVGVAAVNAGATFEATTLKTSMTAKLALTPTVIVATPENPYVCLPVPSNPVRTQSVGRNVAVATSSELKAAIIDAQPGDTITMADGVYSDSMLSGNYTGSFSITADGTAQNPITLTGSPAAVIDGNGPNGRYGLYLNGANYWNLDGFTVANASKGIMFDRSSHGFIEDMHVTNIGAEAVHFRAFSSDNVIVGSQITGTGKASAQFGEGVYVGSASGANWGIHTGGLPDTSDRNVILNNTFTDFTAEGIDIKEGTTGNYIAGNTFEGSSLSGENSADSWVDIKGRCNLVENNSGTNTLLDGYQVHNVFETWASYNVFRNNVANVNATGYGFTLDFNSRDLGNRIECSNTVIGAAAGYANVACSL